jgi:hypothetical protein
MSTPQTTTAQIRSGRLQSPSKASVGERWLVLPRVRFHDAFTGTSYEAQKPARGRCDAKLDYTLRQLPREISQTSATGTSIDGVAEGLNPALLKKEIAGLLSDRKIN